MSATLIWQSVAYITTSNANALNSLLAGSVLLAAGCLLVGFLTPIVAVVIGLGAIVLAFVGRPLPLLDVVVLSAVILCLGPGAFSFDARMFGRRVIRIPAVSHPTAK